VVQIPALSPQANAALAEQMTTAVQVQIYEVLPQSYLAPDLPGLSPRSPQQHPR
jgi:hypothetical protein